MTKYELGIAKLTEGVIKIVADLENLRSNQDDINAILRRIEEKFADLDKRVTLLERESADRSKLMAEARVANAGLRNSILTVLVSAIIAAIVSAAKR